jgi:hypothetical protein
MGRAPRFASLALAAVLGLLVTSGLAWARPVDIFRILLLQVGEPATVGVLTSAAGASITNSTTAVTFSLPAVSINGQVLSVQCDATAFVGFSTTCGTTLATSNGCFRLGANDPPRIIIVRDTQTAINAAGPAAFNCVVNRLQ